MRLFTLIALFVAVLAEWHAINVSAGVRTEVGFNTFQVCVTADVTGVQPNKVVVSGDILLDNGGRSRTFAYEIGQLLSPAERAQLRSDFLVVFNKASQREDVPTPRPTPTSTFTAGGGAPTPTPTRTATPTITQTLTPGPTSTP